MNRLEGQVAVFTGAGAGIGKSVVERYVREGARVVAVDISEERVTQLRDELGSAIEPIAVDVSSWEGNQSAVNKAVEKFGKLDVFVGNAGITDGARMLEDIDGADVAGAFSELFAVNVLAPLLGARAALPHLVNSNGSIILTASFASSNSAGGGVLYTASKHAVLGIVRQLAYEFAPDVRVNGVAPGVAPTKLRGISSLGQSSHDSVLDGTSAVLPLQEVPGTDAYAGVFTLLASREESGAMTGTVITADSGLGIRGLKTPGGRVGRRTSQPS
ncbi:SDR family NAD(P)-dependent oxidoreductase [Paenarthrobacter nitroguajacolicus]|uniref:SDR family NAD(P)-dependent oxidoreductase n=1 Tax=Paenarthrobacter nitroguajacolicus TaxID=211146 RepID=UPI0034404847